jgi:hypothetical protein
MIDQNNDKMFSSLRSLLAAYPGMREHVKQASVGEEVRASLPLFAFADKSNRRFPLHSAADAVLSKAYATKVANLAEGVMQEIDTALELYEVDPAIFTRQKVGSALQEEPTYLIESQNKLPMYAGTSIKLAEETLLRHKRKLAPRTLASAAVKLVKEAHRRGEEVGVNTLKYAGLVQCDTKTAFDWLEVRAHKATNPGVADAYTKLASVVERIDSTVSRDDLIKLSSAIQELDLASGFKAYYGKSMLDPVETVFNTKIAMQPHITLAGGEIPLEKLLSISPEAYGDILGEDIVEEISQNGEIVPESLEEILVTLPADMQRSLVAELNL